MQKTVRPPWSARWSLQWQTEVKWKCNSSLLVEYRSNWREVKTINWMNKQLICSLQCSLSFFPKAPIWALAYLLLVVHCLSSLKPQFPKFDSIFVFRLTGYERKCALFGSCLEVLSHYNGCYKLERWQKYKAIVQICFWVYYSAGIRCFENFDWD
jgi:hypothetical protein